MLAGEVEHSVLEEAVGYTCHAGTSYSRNLPPTTCQRTTHGLSEQALARGPTAWWLEVDAGRVAASFSARQDLEESFAELCIEGGVDHRVECAVHITQPCCGAVELWGHVASSAVCVENMGQKERQPADNEGP